MGSSVDVVLFDLGGVLIEFTGVSTMLDLTGMTDATEFWQRWLACPWVRRFESGQCGASEFAAGLVDDWRLAIDPHAFLDAFARWPTGPLPGALELVKLVKRTVVVGCLSNTNELHWRGSVAAWPLLHEFDHRFASFQMGLLKPDLAAFQYVADLLGVDPKRVVFLDDNLVNVDGAAAAGFQAFHAAGIEQTRNALAHVGVI